MTTFLTVRQFSEKHSFLTMSALRWWLFKDREFRRKCCHRLGRKVLLCEESVLEYIKNKHDLTETKK